MLFLYIYIFHMFHMFSCTPWGYSPTNFSHNPILQWISLKILHKKGLTPNHVEAELEKTGSTDSEEPNFFRFSAKSVLFFAKFLPNFTQFYPIWPNFT